MNQDAGSSDFEGRQPAAGVGDGTHWNPWRSWREHIGLLLGLALAALLGLATPDGVARLDLLAYDSLAPQAPVAPEAAIVVAVDEPSLGTLGAWPWPRRTHAELLDALHAAGARVVALPLIFAEPAVQAQDDAALAAAIQRHGAVVLPVVPVPAGAGIAGMPPLERLRAAGARLGHADVEVDLDAQVRSLFLQAGAGAATYPALALAARQAMAPPGARRAALPGLWLDARDRAGASADSWLRNGLVLLPRMGQRERISYAQALRDPAALAQVRGRAVFVGITAAGLGGELASPLGPRATTLPAVDLHAQTFDALATGSLVTPAGAAARWTLSMLLLAPLALWPLRHRARADGRTRRLAWLALLATLLPLALAQLLLATQQLWLPPALATLALAAGFAAALGLHVHDNRRAYARLRARAQATVDAIGEGVLTVDPQGTVRYANQRATALLGAGAAPGQPLGQGAGMAPESLLLLLTALDECLRSQQERRPAEPLLLPLADARSRSLRVAISPLHDPERRPDGAVIVLSDVSETVAGTQMLRHAATHDALTGLPNRSLLLERLQAALGAGDADSRQLAVLFLDMNRFKRINDSLGHRRGDQVLQEVARRLQEQLRPGDLAARWGGDEFVVLMDGVSGAEAVAIAAERCAAALGEDIAVDGMQLSSACSIGIALAPRDGHDADTLLAHADSAMARAKARPQGGVEFYSAAAHQWTRASLALEADLRQALRARQFVLHYQPQFSLPDVRLVGHEALLRWQRRADELLLPREFIDIAEETGLIVEIGAWAVQQVTRDLADALAARQDVLPVAVNVSARQCQDRAIVQVLRRALRDTGVPAALIKLEITETTAMGDLGAVAELLEEISRLGVRIALDDFGTGHSSLSYLKRFPIHEIKIDRSFVQAMTSNADDAAIVRATIKLAHELGIPVVAEGVETDAQRSFLTEHHCDAVQGFLFGRPQALAVRAHAPP